MGTRTTDEFIGAHLFLMFDLGRGDKGGGGGGGRGGGQGCHVRSTPLFQPIGLFISTMSPFRSQKVEHVVGKRALEEQARRREHNTQSNAKLRTVCTAVLVDALYPQQSQAVGTPIVELAIHAMSVLAARYGSKSQHPGTGGHSWDKAVSSSRCCTLHSLVCF